MIYSDRQLGVARTELEKLQTALEALKISSEAHQSWLKNIEISALQSQIADIESEIQEYELLKSGQISFSEMYSLSELPRILIQARIAQGLSQSELASQLNMKPQQIQRYEATDYMGASLARLIEVSDLLGVRTSESFQTDIPDAGTVVTWRDPNAVAWDRFPGKEMIKRNWFKLGRGGNIAEAVKSFVIGAAGPQIVTALHRKKIHSGNAPNQNALLAWQARILSLARKAHEARPFPSFNWDDSWLPELVAMTQLDDGPRQARSLLAARGIILVVERHLPGSYLDGAAMLSGFENPVVGLTLRYDRLDNFWFVLFHELGHVFLHLFDNLHLDFFDEEGEKGQDKLEIEADRFALDTLIAASDWKSCLSRFSLSPEAVNLDAKRLVSVREEGDSYERFGEMGLNRLNLL